MEFLTKKVWNLAKTVLDLANRSLSLAKRIITKRVASLPNSAWDSFLMGSQFYGTLSFHRIVTSIKNTATLYILTYDTVSYTIIL